MVESTDKLQQIYQLLLKEEDLDGSAELSAGTSIIPFPHIFVQFNSDNDIDAHVLVLSIVPKGPLQQSFGLEQAGDLLQGVSPFPYEVPKGKLPELNRLLSLMNKILVFGCFGYDEVEKRCFYRFTYPMKPEQPVDLYVSIVIRLACEVINTYAPTIEQLSAGIVSLEDLLKPEQNLF